MTTTEKIIYFGVAGIAAYWLYKKFSSLADVQINLADVSIGGDLLYPKLNMRFAVVNYSGVTATVKSISGDVFINDTQKIASVNYYTPVTINPAGNTFVDVPVTTFLPYVLSSAVDLVKGHISSVTFRGFVNVNGIDIPANLNYQW